MTLCTERKEAFACFCKRLSGQAAAPHPFNATSVAASFSNQWASSRNAGGSICFFVRKCKKNAICLDIYGGGN